METVRRKKILCFGLVMADILLDGLDALPTHWEQTLRAENAMIGVGGGAANSAIAIGKLGGKTDILGRVGGDTFGEFIRSRMLENGVGCDCLIRDEELSTGICAGLVHKTGKRCFITMRGSNNGITQRDFDRIDLNDYCFLHINGFFQFPNVENSLGEILGGFKDRGIPISLDLASSDPDGKWYSRLTHFVHLIDYFFLNATQLVKLMRETGIPACASKLMDAGVKAVVVKLGGDGCSIYKDNRFLEHVPVKPQDNIKDTTGAGDSFDAAYVLGLTQGWDDIKCACFANTVASMNCLKLGATAGVPDFKTAMKETLAFYTSLKE